MWTKQLFQRKSSRGTLFMSFDVVAKTKQTCSYKIIALAKHEFCQNQLFPSSWSEDHDIMKKAIVQKRQITLLRKKVERIMAKSWICLKTCSMMMKFVQLVKEGVKLLRSNFGISIKLLKVALSDVEHFPIFSIFVDCAKQKTTWVLEWFPYVERVFLRIVTPKHFTVLRKIRAWNRQISCEICPSVC